MGCYGDSPQIGIGGPWVIISAYAGYAADFVPRFEPSVPEPGLRDLAVGNQATASLYPRDGTDWSMYGYLVEEAERRTVAGSPTLAANAPSCYYYDGDNAVRMLSGSPLAIDELKGLVQSLANQ